MLRWAGSPDFGDGTAPEDYFVDRTLDSPPPAAASTAAEPSIRGKASSLNGSAEWL